MAMNAKMYLNVFIALLVLTVLTFLQPSLFGSELSDTVAAQMFIALVKTILIVAYYMHIKYETTLFRVIIFVAIITLGIFFAITASDAIFRNETFDLFQ